MISSSISKEDAQIQNSRKKKTNNNLTVSGMANHYKAVSAESCLMEKRSTVVMWHIHMNE